MAYSGLYHPRKDEPRHKANRPLYTSNSESILSPIFKKMEAIDLESDDLLLLLIIYLMYRESGDKDLLIMMGALLFG